MSNNQLAGFPAFGSRVDTMVTYRPRQIIPDPAMELPTSDPGTGAPNVEITVSSGDLPEFAPIVPPPISTEGAAFSDKYIVYIVVQFYNPTGASVRVNERHTTADNPTWTTTTQYQNVGAGGRALYFFGANGHQYPKMRLWAAAAGILMEKVTLAIIPRYIGLGIAGVKDLIVELSDTSLTDATSITSWGWSLRVNSAASTTSGVSFVAAQASPTEGFGYPVVSFGWSSIISTASQPRYPTRIAYTPLL